MYMLLLYILYSLCSLASSLALPFWFSRMSWTVGSKLWEYKLIFDNYIVHLSGKWVSFNLHIIFSSTIAQWNFISKMIMIWNEHFHNVKYEDQNTYRANSHCINRILGSPGLNNSSSIQESSTPSIYGHSSSYGTTTSFNQVQIERRTNPTTVLWKQPSILFRAVNACLGFNKNHENIVNLQTSYL